MQTLFSSFLDKDNLKYPFSLIDMKVNIPDYQIGFSKLLELADANILSTQNIGSSNSSAFALNNFKAPTSLWKGFDGASDDTSVGIAEGGFYLSIDNLQGSRKFTLDTSSAVSDGLPNQLGLISYVNKLAIALFPSSAVSSFYPSYTTLSNGSVIFSTKSNGSPSVPVSAFLMRNDGVCFCFNSKENFLYFGTISSSASQASYNHISKIAGKKLYAIKAVHAVASGTVYDAANQPSAGCRVFAYNRATGKLIGSAISGIDGRYVCYVNATKGSEIFMVCLDNAVAPDFEAQIIDRIIV